jgi:iron complex outermembrane receptor protein
VVNWHAGLRQHVGSWRLEEFVRVDNVFDESYVGSVIVNAANARYFEPAPERTWLVGFTAGYSPR